MAPTPPTPPVRRGRPPKQPVADLSLLSPEARDRITKEQEAKLNAERIKLAEDAFAAKIFSDLRREKGLEEELVTFTLNLAEFCDRIVLDGTVYFHDREYTVERSKYDSMRDIAYRTYTHQMEIDGKKRSTIRPQNLQLSPHGVVNTSNLMRV